MNKLKSTLAGLIFIATAQGQAAVQPRGYIANHAGTKCPYTQAASPDAQYFHKIPGASYELTFVDPQCMAGTGLEGEINKMMINNAITRAYGKTDAKFMTRLGDLQRTSPLQVRGQCIQSATYAGIGVAVEYLTAGNGIASVRHAATVGGCSK